MKIWFHHVVGFQRTPLQVPDDQVYIGRGESNDVVLDSPLVAEHAAVLQRADDEWMVTALGINGCDVGEMHLRNGESRRFTSGQNITIFPFSLSLDANGASQGNGPTGLLEELETDLVTHIHDALLTCLKEDPRSSVSTSLTEEHRERAEELLDEICLSQRVEDQMTPELIEHVASQCVRAELISHIIGDSSLDSEPTGNHDSKRFGESAIIEHWETELAEVIRGMLESMEISTVTDLSEQVRRVESQFPEAWAQTVDTTYDEFHEYLALRRLKKQVLDIVFGYGPIEDLLKQPLITEIMVVDSSRIYIEKDGVIENSGRRFISDEVTVTIIERIVSQVDRRIDKSEPLVDARLKDGSRVNAVIPPIAVSGPCLTIRKFPARRFQVEDLILKGSLTRPVADFLCASVAARKNIIIAGGTGSGKTTLLNCLSNFIPKKERIVTIEDTTELQIAAEHVVQLEVKRANVEGRGSFEIKDLLKNALRMRPDRIVIGECRGAEALDMLQAMNTGHDGSMTTIHANGTTDAILRLETLVQQAARIPISSIHRQISSAVDLIVQLRRTRSGKRIVVQVTEVLGIDPTTSTVETKDIFAVNEQDELRPTGRLPTYIDELIDRKLLRMETLYC